ncbi:hypothetical protein [Streptomyces sp. TR06-5]|uniref:hypothetical protein n=1 Tax=unclassified Streptomyces TaxID=2593676 RepID=UPI00399EF363
MKRNRTTALAVLLGAFALLGTGLAQAQQEDAPDAPSCTTTEHGFRCVRHVERTYTTEGREAESSSSVSCSATVEIPQQDAMRRSTAAEEDATEADAAQAPEQREQVREDTTMECSGDSSR